MTGKVTLFLITPIVKNDYTDYEKIAPMLEKIAPMLEKIAPKIESPLIS
jgi:hypothetical protein